MAKGQMQRASINGTELEYEVRGTGEPVVLVHGGLAEAFVPLLAELALTERYQLISYHRRGYGKSRPPIGPTSVAEQAADCRALIQYLGIRRAHVVGHSFGGNIALQLALDAPDTVQSLALLEPALPSDLLDSPEFRTAMGRVMAMYQSGDKAGALDAFFQGAFGPDYRRVFDQVLPPGAFERAVPAVDTLFQYEFPALQSWSFTREAAARIPQPTLPVVGSDSLPVAQEIQNLLQAWLSHAEGLVLLDAAHLLMMQNPRGMAEGLVSFLSRHPMQGYS